MKALLEILAKTAAAGAAKTAANALESGADYRTVGIAAAGGALAGLLSLLLTHPATAVAAPHILAIAHPPAAPAA